MIIISSCDLNDTKENCLEDSTGVSHEDAATV